MYVFACGSAFVCVCVCVCVCVWLTAPRCIFVSPPHYYHIFHYTIHYVVLGIYYMDALHTHLMSHVSCTNTQSQESTHPQARTHARTHTHTHARTHANTHARLTRQHTRASNIRVRQKASTHTYSLSDTEKGECTHTRARHNPPPPHTHKENTPKERKHAWGFPLSRV